MNIATYTYAHLHNFTIAHLNTGTLLHTCTRVITAGGNKDLLNPMKPLRDEDVEVIFIRHTYITLVLHHTRPSPP